MKRYLLIALVLCSSVAFGQALSGVNGDCQIGGQQALTSGLPSTATQQIGTTNVNPGAGVQASFPKCLVTVYATGTTNKANIYSTNTLTPTPLSNPFVANVDGSFTFFAAAGCYDVSMSSGAGPALPYTRSLSGVCVGQGTVTIPGGSGTVAACGTPGALAYYSVSGTTVTCDPSFVTDGSGNAVATSMTFNGAGAGFVGFVQGTVPPLSTANTAYLYSDTSIPATFGTVLPTAPGTLNQILAITGVVDATHIKTGWVNNTVLPGCAEGICLQNSPSADQTITGGFDLVNDGGGFTAINSGATPSDSTISLFTTLTGQGELFFSSVTNSLSSNLHFNPATGAIVMIPPSQGPDDGGHGVVIGNSGLSISGQYSDGVALLVNAGNAIIAGAGASSPVIQLGSTGVEGIFTTAPPSGGGSYTFRSDATASNNVIHWPNGSGTLALVAGSSTCTASGTAANPSVVSCSAAPAGIVYCDVAASAGTCTINTTAVTTHSSITITPSTADGTLLSKTCNTSPSAMPAILLAAKVNATSFTLNMPTGITNGFCFEYSMVN